MERVSDRPHNDGTANKLRSGKNSYVRRRKENDCFSRNKGKTKIGGHRRRGFKALRK